MPDDTIHLMVDDIMVDYMKDLIAGRQPPNLFADGPLEPEDFPVFIQVPKFNLLVQALQAKIDLADFTAGLARLVADGSILEMDAVYLIALEYEPPDENERHD